MIMNLLPILLYFIVVANGHPWFLKSLNICLSERLHVSYVDIVGVTTTGIRII